MIRVVARPRVPEENTVELTLEKIRAGILPVPADNILDRIIEHARRRGVDVQWKRRDGYPVVVMSYTPNLSREDVQLEELEIRTGPDPPGGALRPHQGGLPDCLGCRRARCFNPPSRGGTSTGDGRVSAEAVRVQATSPTS